MADITIPPGFSIVNWIGPATTLSGQPWFTSTNLNGVFKQSANRAGFISAKPGAAFPAFTQVVPPASGQRPEGYIFNAKVAFQLDSSLIGAIPSRLFAHFAANSAAFPLPIPITLADQPGVYGLDTANSSGVTSVSYLKNGTAASLPVTLALNDILTVTGTTSSAVGVVTLVQQ